MIFPPIELSQYIVVPPTNCRCRHAAWENGCDTLTVVGLHENWTLALRFQVSVVKKVRTGLKPDTRHLKPILQEAFSTPDKVQKKDLIFYHFTTSEIME